MYKNVFYIEEVVKTFNLEIKKNYNTHLQVSCPFCNDKNGKMRVDIINNRFRCPVCDTSGGTVKLYSLLANVSVEEAYIVLKENNYNADNKAIYRKKEKDVKNIMTTSILVSQEELHKTYKAFLNLCTLKEVHRKKLLERGISDYEVGRCNFKSVPTDQIYNIVSKLERQGVQLTGVAGFYEDNGKIVLNISKKSNGIIFPIINENGFITALQYRLDEPFNKSRYLFFSSGNKYKGCSPKDTTHFIMNNIESDVVIVTEGALKACVINSLKPNLNIVAFQSASVSGKFEKVILKLKQLRFKVIFECFDMDKKTNVNVMKSVDKFVTISKENNFNIKSTIWDSKYKGFDDLLNSKNKSA